MARNLCEYGENFEEVHQLVDYALATYHDMASNRILFESTLPIKKVFIRLLLRKRFWLAENFVSVYSLIKQFGKTVMEHRHS